MRDRISEEAGALKRETLENAAGMFARLDDRAFDAEARAQQGIVGAVITVVVVGVVGLVGMLIFSEIIGAVPLDIEAGRTDPANATDMEIAAANLEGGFGSAMELLPIVLIVLVASLVIAVIARFR